MKTLRPDLAVIYDGCFRDTLKYWAPLAKIVEIDSGIAYRTPDGETCPLDQYGLELSEGRHGAWGGISCHRFPVEMERTKHLGQAMVMMILGKASPKPRSESTGMQHLPRMEFFSQLSQREGIRLIARLETGLRLLAQVWEYSEGPKRSPWRVLQVRQRLTVSFDNGNTYI